jgi:hypothetical protein
MRLQAGSSITYSDPNVVEKVGNLKVDDRLEIVYCPRRYGVPGTPPFEDCAFAVEFEGRAEPVWFSAALLEFVDHGPGTEIRISRVAKKWSRSNDGSWVESNISRTLVEVLVTAPSPGCRSEPPSTW